MRRRNIFIMPVVLVLAMLACNMPGTQDTGGAAATITAQAAIIETQNAVASIAATPTNIAPTDTPPATLTPTPSVLTVTVSQTTNFRTGPSTQYDLLASLNPGQSAQVVGKYTPANYWIIDTPGSTGTCWLWGQFATTSGNVNSVPEMAQPPTPTPGPTDTPTATATPALPASPNKFKETHVCTSGGALYYNVHVVLTWTDNATNEDGFYLDRNGALLVTLAPNTVTYTDDTTLSKLIIVGSSPPSLAYSIQAFNGSGASTVHDLTFGCP